MEEIQKEGGNENMQIQTVKERAFKRAFTLIELIVVMAVIGVLAMLATPRFMERTKEAKRVAVQYDTKVLSDAAENYHIRHESWPVREMPTPLPVGVMGVGGVDFLLPLDNNKISDAVGLKGMPADYGMVTSGNNEGEVFSLGTDPVESQTKEYGLIGREALAYFDVEKPLFHDDGSMEVSIAGDTSTGGIYIENGKHLALKPSTYYLLRYTYQKTDGKLVSFGGHVGEGAIAKTHVFVDGTHTPNDYYDGHSAFVRDDHTEHTVSVVFKTKPNPSVSSSDFQNALFIQPNRFENQPVKVLISGLELVEIVAFKQDILEYIENWNTKKGPG